MSVTSSGMTALLLLDVLLVALIQTVFVCATSKQLAQPVPIEIRVIVPVKAYEQDLHQ